MPNRKEIEPPWVYAPEFEPARAFWRQEGELWLTAIWLPFWESLSSTEREDYLKRWDIPEVWRKFSYHINPAYKEWVDSLDDPDLPDSLCSEESKPVISFNQFLFIFLAILAASIMWLLL